VVGRGQPLTLVEHLFVEDPGVVACHRDRGDMVEGACVERGREVEGGPRPADVELLVALVGGGHVVERRDVEEVVDAPAVVRHPALVDPEQRAPEVALHDAHTVGSPPATDHGLEPGLGPRPHEQGDLAVTVGEELLDEVAADEAGRAGHEVGHAAVSAVVWAVLGAA
jgi:hypothetical protein